VASVHESGRIGHLTHARSALFMPASNERALEKARDLPADALIFDLEDAVAPAQKAHARELACNAATSHNYAGRTLAIRVNGIGSEWHDDDLKAVAAAGPDAIVVPKVESPEQVLAVQHTLEQNNALAETRIWAMLETPAAILQATEIAASTPRLTALIVGTNDLLKDLRADQVPGRRPLLTSLSLCILAARAAGKAILDGVYNDVRDLEGFTAECRDGRELGFDGKSLIHPGQIEICNAVFSPSAVDIEYARRVIEAFEQATANGAAVATLDGRMIEGMHVQSARRVLALAGRQAPA
jgi:citrate lyase subunit beta/citryl-CoA lyase